VKYFFDTNVIIDLLGRNQKKEQKKESQSEKKDREEKAQLKAIQKLEKIMLEDKSEIFINRLIVMETLRTIHFDQTNVFKKAEETLNTFRQVDIRPKIYEDAINFSRFCNTKELYHLKGKCEAIDFLHFMTAKYYNLEMISFDGDMETLENSYIKYIEKNK
jgi:predicted nucleic acid-binding protein